MPDTPVKERTRIQRLGVAPDPELAPRLRKALRDGRNPIVAKDAAEGYETVLIDGPVPDEQVPLAYGDLPCGSDTKDRYQVRETAREWMARYQDQQVRYAEAEAEEDRLHRRWKACPECGSAMHHAGAGRRYCQNPSCAYPGHD